MFDHNRGGGRAWLATSRLAIAKLPNGGQSRLEIHQVVEAELLALELARCAPALGCRAIPSGALVGIFPVAQPLYNWKVKRQRGLVAWLIHHRATPLFGQPLRPPTTNRRVVGRRVAEGFEGQLPPQGPVHLSSFESLQEGWVLIRVGENGHMSMIFRRCSHHGGPANVDLLNRLLPADARLGDGAHKGIEIHNHHIDGLNALGF